MADNFPVINAAGATTYIRAIQLAGGTYVNMSVPSLANGTAMIGSATMANSMSVVIATDQAAITAIVTGIVTANVSGSITATNASAALASVSATSGTPTAVAVKASSGVLSMVGTYCNSTTYPVFLKIFNVTAAGVSSAVVPVINIGIPPGGVSNVPIPAGGLYLGGTGISYLVTKLVANNDTTAVANYDLVGAIGYI